MHKYILTHMYTQTHMHAHYKKVVSGSVSIIARMERGVITSGLLSLF